MAYIPYKTKLPSRPSRALVMNVCGHVLGRRLGITYRVETEMAQTPFRWGGPDTWNLIDPCFGVKT